MLNNAAKELVPNSNHSFNQSVYSTSWRTMNIHVSRKEVLRNGTFSKFRTEQFTQLDANISDNAQVYSIYADYRSLNIYDITYNSLLNEKITLKPLLLTGIGLERDNLKPEYQIWCKIWFLTLIHESDIQSCTTLA